MNLKYFRKFQKETADRIGLSYAIMHVLLYAYHSEVFTKVDILKDVPLGALTIQNGIKGLQDRRLIKRIRGGGNNMKAIYHITSFGKREIKMMYNNMKQKVEAEQL